MLYVKRLSEFARIPSRSSVEAAGLDLYSAHDYTVPANDRCLCATDVALIIENNCYGRIAARSGIAAQYSISVGAGVIDSDYRGNIQILLFNHSDKDFVIRQGDRVAQIIIEKIARPVVIEVDSLSETQRGQSGFGSTGI